MRFALEGLIGSGKSEVIRGLQAKGYKAELESTEAWTLLPQFYTEQKKYAFAFESQVIASYAHSKYHECNIMERSPDSAIDVFSEILCNTKSLTESQRSKLYAAYTTMPVARADSIIYLDVPVDVCLERIHQRALADPKRLTETLITKEYMDSIREQYSTFFSGRSVERLKLSGQETIDEVVSQVDSILKKVF